jgi:hypothetical protein
MEGYVIGLAVGLGAGIVVGVSMGRKQKSWSELTAGEKKIKIVSLTVAGVLFIAGVVVFLIRL